MRNHCIHYPAGSILSKKLKKSERLTRLVLYGITFLSYYFYGVYLDNGRNQVLAELIVQLEIYHAEHGEYPRDRWLERGKDRYPQYQMQIHYLPSRNDNTENFILLFRSSGYFEWIYDPSSKSWYFSPS